MEDKCPYCGEPYMETLKKYGCDFLASTPIRSRGCYARQISNLQASRDRWREYAMSLKRQQYQELITEDMIAEEYKAIAALKAAGEWEE